MTPGQLVRRLLGPRFFPAVGNLYRALFVDLEKVADSFPPMPPDGHLLEIGGGHGQMLNVVLARYPRITATRLDISDQVGDELRPEFRPRVEIRAGTSIAQYAAGNPRRSDLIVLCDVVHHVPKAERGQFLRDLDLLVKPGVPLAVKDIRPGSIRGWFAEASDRYVSGDRAVRFIPESEMQALFSRHIPGLSVRPTTLSEVNPPNYCLVFSR
jgi:cyclopropane fatty-acyl-phospholipid synthase-like methyltransferase